MISQACSGNASLIKVTDDHGQGFGWLYLHKNRENILLAKTSARSLHNQSQYLVRKRIPIVLFFDCSSYAPLHVHAPAKSNPAPFLLNELFSTLLVDKKAALILNVPRRVEHSNGATTSAAFFVHREQLPRRTTR